MIDQKMVLPNEATKFFLLNRIDVSGAFCTRWNENPRKKENLSGHTHPAGVTTEWFLEAVDTVRGIPRCALNSKHAENQVRGRTESGSPVGSILRKGSGGLACRDPVRG